MTTPEQLRIGDAERDKTTTALHEHFVQGRLTRDELDERLDATLTARTVGDLRRVTQDLPEQHDPRRAESYKGPGPVAPRGQPRRHHPWPHRPPFLFFLLPLVLIGAFAAGSGFAVIRVIFFVWLVLTVLKLLRPRGWHNHHARTHWRR